MFKRVLATLISMAFVISCSSKPKEPEVDANNLAGGDTTDIRDTPLEFDSRGAEGGNIPGLNIVPFAYDSSTLTAEAKQDRKSVV